MTGKCIADENVLLFLDETSDWPQTIPYIQVYTRTKKKSSIGKKKNVLELQFQAWWARMRKYRHIYINVGVGSIKSNNLDCKAFQCEPLFPQLWIFNHQNSIFIAQLSFIYARSPSSTLFLPTSAKSVGLYSKCHQHSRISNKMSKFLLGPYI